MKKFESGAQKRQKSSFAKTAWSTAWIDWYFCLMICASQWLFWNWIFGLGPTYYQIQQHASRKTCHRKK